MKPTLTISSRDELISFIPHVLGFHPESSMACMAIGGGLSPALNLPQIHEGVRRLLDIFTDTYLHRHPTSRFALVARGEKGRERVEALSALGEALVTDWVPGSAVGPVMWVNGIQWLDVLGGTRGGIDPTPAPDSMPSLRSSAEPCRPAAEANWRPR